MVDDIIADFIYYHTDATETMRIYAYQHAQPNLVYNNAKSSFKYMYNLIPGMKGILHYSSADLTSLPFVAIYAESLTSDKTFFFNYEVDTSFLACNKNDLEIVSIVNKLDTCVEVTVKYNGKGELYMLGGIENINVPTALEVVQTGVYLGLYTCKFHFY